MGDSVSEAPSSPHDGPEMPRSTAIDDQRRSIPYSLTSTLACTNVLAGFATWFAMGYSATAINGPQAVVVKWVRSVKCRKFGGQFDANGTNAPSQHNGTTNLILWCRHIEAKDQIYVLAENPELNRIWGTATSMICIGGLITTISAALFIRGLGVRWTVLLSTVILATGSLLDAVSVNMMDSVELFIFGRFIIGSGIGLMLVITPVYTSEITPAKLRGTTGTIPNIMLVLGFITATGLGLPHILGNEKNWPYLIAIQIIPAVVACITIPFCPESPRHLYIVESRLEEAEKALKWLRRTNDVSAEMQEMQNEKLNQKKAITYVGFFRDPFLRKVFFLCLIPICGAELGGFSILTFYSMTILVSLGLDRVASTYVMIGIWMAHFISSMLSMFLVDRVGRKFLLTISQLGVVLTWITFITCFSLTQRGYEAAKFGSAACAPIFMVFFAIGSGSIPWILPSELFVQESRGIAASLISAFQRICTFSVAFLFPIIFVVAQQFTFLIFAGLLCVLTVLVLWKLPETKGKRLEDIQLELKNSTNSQQ